VWALPVASGPVSEADAILEGVKTRIAGGVAALGNAYDASLLPVATLPPTAEAYQEFREGLRLEAGRQDEEALRHFRLATAIDAEFTWALVHAALKGVMSGRPMGAVDTLLLELGRREDGLSVLERHLIVYLRALRREDWPGSYRAIRAAAAIAPDQFSYTQAIRAITLHRPGEAAVALTRPRLDSIYRDDARNYWFVLTLAYHQLGEHGQELAAVRSARRHSPASASLLAQELRALAALGRTADVMARLDSLVGLPRDGWFTSGAALMQVARELHAHRQRDAASVVLERGIAWYRNRPALEGDTEVHRFMLGWTLYLAGRLDEADSLFGNLHREHPDNVDYIGHLGAIAARRGDPGSARAWSERLRGRAVAAPIPGEESIVWRARIAALLGDRPAAMRLLIEAFGPQGTMELHDNSDFDGMLDHPPFREFVRAKG
jgi:tetratricopeptide (TPR) repeat protein